MYCLVLGLVIVACTSHVPVVAKMFLRMSDVKALEVVHTFVVVHVEALVGLLVEVLKVHLRVARFTVYMLYYCRLKLQSIQI